MIARKPEPDAAEGIAARVTDDPDVTPIPDGFPDLPEVGRTLPAPATMSTLAFPAESNGAGLWDLVQLECQVRSRRVFQVTGEGGVGYLYFAGGRVIHAVTPRLSGESAALEILGWSQVVFRPCERGWPTIATIDASHESLLLRAASGRQAAAGTNLVAFRGPLSVSAESDRANQRPIEKSQLGEVVMPEIRRPNNDEPTGPVSIARKDELSDFSVMVRVAPSGAIVKNKGASEDLAAVVAYTHRLVELVGELLGLAEFVAMECTFKEGTSQAPGGGTPRFLLFSETNGDAVALRPRGDSNIQPLRESLGL